MSFPSFKRSAPARLLAVAGSTFALAAGVAVMAPHASAAAIPGSSATPASSGTTKCQLVSHDLQYGEDQGSGRLTFHGDGNVVCDVNPDTDAPALTGTATIVGAVGHATCEGTDTNGSATVDVKWSDGTETITQFDRYKADSDGDVVVPTLQGKNADSSTRFAGDDATATGMIPSACGGDVSGPGSPAVALTLDYQPAPAPQQQQ